MQDGYWKFQSMSRRSSCLWSIFQCRYFVFIFFMVKNSSLLFLSMNEMRHKQRIITVKKRLQRRRMRYLFFFAHPYFLSITIRAIDEWCWKSNKIGKKNYNLKFENKQCFIIDRTYFFVFHWVHVSFNP